MAPAVKAPAWSINLFLDDMIVIVDKLTS